MYEFDTSEYLCKKKLFPVQLPEEKTNVISIKMQFYMFYITVNLYITANLKFTFQMNGCFQKVLQRVLSWIRVDSL